MTIPAAPRRRSGAPLKTAPPTPPTPLSKGISSFTTGAEGSAWTTCPCRFGSVPTPTAACTATWSTSTPPTATTPSGPFTLTTRSELPPIITWSTYGRATEEALAVAAAGDNGCRLVGGGGHRRRGRRHRGLQWGTAGTGVSHRPPGLHHGHAG